MHASDSPPADDPARPGNSVVPTPAPDRRGGGSRSDRRATSDRRQKQVVVPVDRRAGGDRRAQVDRRDPSKRAGNYDLDEETLEFIGAVNRFKTETGRSFPTWSEVLEIVRALGYVKEPSSGA